MREIKFRCWHRLANKMLYDEKPGGCLVWQNGFVTNTISQFFSDSPPGIFEPCAYYDKHLDCIRVQIKECSFTEIRINKIFNIYEANHTSDIEYVGFSIKGIRYIFEKAGVPSKAGPYMLAEIMDTIIKSNPDAFSDLIQREFAHMLDLKVEGFQYDSCRATPV